VNDWGLFHCRSNEGIFSLCHCGQTGSGAHPSSYPMGLGLFPWDGEVKQLLHEANHSPPSSAKVKKV
jgi:hypothetical protein